VSIGKGQVRLTPAIPRSRSGLRLISRPSPPCHPRLFQKAARLNHRKLLPLNRLGCFLSRRMVGKLLAKRLRQQMATNKWPRERVSCKQALICHAFGGWQVFVKCFCQFGRCNLGFRVRPALCVRRGNLFLQAFSACTRSNISGTWTTCLENS